MSTSVNASTLLKWRNEGVRLINKPILLNLTSRWVDVVDPASSKDADRLEIQWPHDSEEWSSAVGEVSGQIAALIEQGKLKGRAAVVFYRSPSLACQLSSLSAPTRRQAESAARLNTLGSVRYGADQAVIDAAYIGRDRGGESPQVHFVTAIDRLGEAEAVANLIEQAGLKLDAMLPLEALVISHLVTKILRWKGPTQGWLHVGLHGSYFAVAGDGRLQLFRQIGLGVNQLVEALTRPLRVNHQAEPISLSFEQAATVLYRFGIPSRDTVIDEKLGIGGAHVKSLIQPELQRLLVELKQTLRFSVEQEQGTELPLTLTGPGGGLPGLDSLLVEATGMTIEADEQSSETDPEQAESQESELDLALSEKSDLTPLNLMPKTALVRQTARRFKISLWAGAAAALMLMTADATRLSWAVQRSEADLLEAKNRQQQTEASESRRERLMIAKAAVKQLENQVSAKVDFVGDWPAILIELSRRSTPTIRLFSVTVSAHDLPEKRKQSGPAMAFTMQIEGCVIGANADGDLRDYVKELKQSPLVAVVKLGQIQRTQLEAEPAKRFTLKIAGGPIPRMTETLLALGDGGTGP